MATIPTRRSPKALDEDRRSLYGVGARLKQRFRNPLRGGGAGFPFARIHDRVMSTASRTDTTVQRGKLLPSSRLGFQRYRRASLHESVENVHTWNAKPSVVEASSARAPV